jgi:two-component system, OmpR family, phosphate regulon response regulator OmpR
LLNDHGDNPTVLVVEDDPRLLSLMQDILSTEGFATGSAKDAADGLSLVREREGGFDLAIIDMVMPGVSGLDLATDLAREYPKIPILYISGYVGSLAAEALARRSPERVLLKPFTPQALVERVRAMLQIAPRCNPGQAATSSKPAIRNGTLG